MTNPPSQKASKCINRKKTSSNKISQWTDWNRRSAFLRINSSELFHFPSTSLRSLSRRFPQNRHKHVLAGFMSNKSMHALHLCLTICSTTYEICHGKSKKLVSCSPTKLFVRSCCNKNSCVNKWMIYYWKIHTNIFIHTSFHMGVPGSHGHPEFYYCCAASSWYEGTLPRSLRHLHHDPLHQSSPDSFCLFMAPLWPSRDVHLIAHHASYTCEVSIA